MARDVKKRLEQGIKPIFDLWRTMQLARRCTPVWTAASVALLLLQSLLPLLSLYLMKLLVDTLTNALTVSDKVAAFAPVAVLVGLTGLAALFNSTVGSLARLVTEAQGQEVSDHISELLLAKSIEVDLEHYETSEYYDTFYRAQRETPVRVKRVVSGAVQLAQSSACLLALSGLLLAFQWIIAVAMIFAFVPGILVRLRHASQLYRWRHERTVAERRSMYFHFVLTADVHAKEIRLFGLGQLFMRHFADLRRKLRNEYLLVARERLIFELITQTGATMAIFGSYLFVAHQTSVGVITLGDLVLYFQAFQRGQGFLKEIMSSVGQLYEDSLFLADLYQFLDVRKKITEPALPKSVPHPLRCGIELNHVSFRYPGSSKMALEGITLVVRPREHIALVGENGSGKTTLVKLLCRLYDPTAGVITVDGVDLRELRINQWREEIGVIFQDYARYHATAWENVWFGNIDSPCERERIVVAARQAGADEVLRQLPQAYDTMLGKWFQDGLELSMGEWQKVALARAFLRMKNQLLVLDEPTSTLDAHAEYKVFRRFRQLAENRTVILISHRLSTVSMADCIYVLESGRIIERGDHAMLMRHGGRYAEMFELQARSYRLDGGV